jgi:hypothetical protein
MTIDDDSIRMADLTTGSLCKIGVTLSSCFWLPVALAMGVAAAAGYLPMGGAAEPLVRFVIAALQGIAASLATDVLLVVGAVTFSASRKMHAASRLRLRPSVIDDRDGQ